MSLPRFLRRPCWFRAKSWASKILFGVEAVDGDVEGGVGVFERVGAGEFEGAIENAQAAFHFRQRLGAAAADFASSCRDGFDSCEGVSRRARRLRMPFLSVVAFPDRRSAGETQDAVRRRRGSKR